MALKILKLVTDTKPQTKDIHRHQNAQNTKDNKYQHSKQTKHIIFKQKKKKRERKRRS